VQGVVTDEAGWPVLRAGVTLNDAAGKTIGSFETKSDGRYEILSDEQCAGCKLAVERTGFFPLNAPSITTARIRYGSASR